MSRARLVITAVTVEKRPVSEVARELRGRPVVDLCTAGPAPGRGRGGVRARSRRPKTAPNAVSPGTVELIVALRKELAGQGLDAGPDTIAWHLEHHHRVAVSAATITGTWPRAAWSSGTEQAAEVVLHQVRG